MDKCVVSGERSSSILHEHGHILKSARIICLAWVKCACGSIDPAQRLSTSIFARQERAPVKCCTVYSVTIAQELPLCERSSTARLSSERDFPCIQLLDIAHWFSVRWGSMPKLQALQLRAPVSIWSTVTLGQLAPLKMLALSWIKCTSVLRHSQSLTRLMLHRVSFMDAISGPVTFPFLTYLSLSAVRGLKPHLNAPRLVTYHEARFTVDESFNTPLPSLVEYGVSYTFTSSSDPAVWHLSFPNIQRLAIRADNHVLLSLFISLANQPHLLPALQKISARGWRGRTYRIAEGLQEKIKSLVLVRNAACDGNVTLCIETVVPFQIPLFYANVSDFPIERSYAFLMHILGTRPCYLRILRSQVLACLHLLNYETRIIVFVTLEFIFLPRAV